MVGTSVRESRYDAIIASTTASASGVNRYRAAPVRKITGTNTMQMHSVETKAGTAICMAPSRMARTIGLPMAKIAVDVFDFHRGIVHQNADRQRHAAQRHDVDGLVAAGRGRRAK